MPPATRPGVACPTAARMPPRPASRSRRTGRELGCRGAGSGRGAGVAAVQCDAGIAVGRGGDGEPGVVIVVGGDVVHQGVATLHDGKRRVEVGRVSRGLGGQAGPTQHPRVIGGHGARQRQGSAPASTPAQCSMSGYLTASMRSAPTPKAAAGRILPSFLPPWPSSPACPGTVGWRARQRHAPKLARPR